MTTMNIADIAHKKKVSAYNPNSYRIFCEDISNDPVSDYQQYVNTAPEIYSHPPVIPAQAIEDRNRPHGGRAAGFLRENTRTLNDPVAVINPTRNYSSTSKNAAEKRWWEWNTQAQDDDPNWKLKKRSNSSANLQNLKERNHVPSNGDNGFQTTYQKEHGYLTTDFYRKPGSLASAQGGAQRHANNPNTIHATGIAPVTEFKNYVPDNQERILVDRVSFDHGYDARDISNYPSKGKRHGAFVIEQVEPKAQRGTRNHQDLNKGTSVWDCMHHDADATNEKPPVYNKTFSAKSNASEARNYQQQQQRRDPIGYFQDTKYQEQQQQPRPDSLYKPSWSNGYNDLDDYQNAGQQQQQQYIPNHPAMLNPELVN